MVVVGGVGWVVVAWEEGVRGGGGEGEGGVELFREILKSPPRTLISDVPSAPWTSINNIDRCYSRSDQ